MEIAKNVKAGMSPPEARRVALVAFGGFDRAVEAHRDARGGRFIEDALADVRYAARALGRTPGFIVVSVLTLTISIAIGTLGFTGMNAFIYRPLPVPDGANLLAGFTSDWSANNNFGSSSYPDIVDFAREAEPLADLAGESRIMLTISNNDEVAYAQGAIITSRYFRALRLKPALGNFPAARDIPAIVISHSLWRGTFGADTSVIGRTVRVNGQPFIIAAVTPPEFRGISRENGLDFWIDGTFSPIVLLRDDMLRRRGNRSFRVTGRLREGASIEALNARMSVLASRLFQENPQAWRDTTGASRAITVMREQEAHLAAVPRTELMLLTAGIVAFGLGIVVIACTNLASMQMARGASRRREIATRLALGAGRGRLIRQLLAETALVAIPGIVLGVVVAMVTSALMSYYRPIPLPSLDLALDWRAMAFIAGSLLVTLLVFGLLPAMQTVKSDVVTDLKGIEVPGATGIRIGGVRGGLIVAQVALSMIFTASAGLVALGLSRHADQGRGDARKVLVARLNFLPAAGDSGHIESTLDEVLDGIRAIPGVRGATAAAFIPLRGSRSTVYGEAETAAGEKKKRELDGNYIRPGYLQFIGLRMLRGRDFTMTDIRDNSAVIVSKQMADALWPGEDALGKRLKINERRLTEVVGVVADPEGFVPATDHSYPGFIYLPLRASREAEIILHISAPTGQAAIIDQTAKLLRRYETQLVAPRAITLDEYYDGMLMPLRLMAQGAGALAILQFALAVAGLSGLVGYVTELRRREIGIRTALGATRGSVLRLVTRQGVRLTTIGVLVGLPISATVSIGVGDVLPMTPSVVLTGLGIAAAVFAVAGTLAMLLPARRALAVTPAAALRVD
jgi:predicted permease